MAFVYWIHLPEHTDILNQGYVGFTSKTVKKRFASHWSEARNGRNKKLYNAMRKYSGKIAVTVIYEGSTEDCLNLEYALRPTEGVAWNHGVGGVAPSFGTVMPEEVKAKISATKRANPKTVGEDTRKRLSDAGKGRKFSDDSRKKMSEKAMRRPKRKPWYTPRANKGVWLLAESAYELYTRSQSQKEASQILGVEYCKLISMFQKFKLGWNPSEDPDWKLFKDSQNNPLN